MMAMRRVGVSCLSTKSPSHRWQWGMGRSEACTGECESQMWEGREAGEGVPGWTRGPECLAYQLSLLSLGQGGRTWSNVGLQVLSRAVVGKKDAGFGWERQWLDWGWFGARRREDGVGTILKVGRDVWGH